MIRHPRPGQRVQIWYARDYAHMMPLHGRVGRVVTVSTGRPRNHGVEVDDGRRVAVPAGNLREVQGEPVSEESHEMV